MAYAIFLLSYFSFTSWDIVPSGTWKTYFVSLPTPNVQIVAFPLLSYFNNSGTLQFGSSLSITFPETVSTSYSVE